MNLKDCGLECRGERPEENLPIAVHLNISADLKWNSIPILKSQFNTKIVLAKTVKYVPYSYHQNYGPIKRRWFSGTEVPHEIWKK